MISCFPHWIANHRRRDTRVPPRPGPKVRAENEKALAKILKPEQWKRLKQIYYQRQGGKAFTDPEVAKAIQLTGDQKKRIRTFAARLAAR